jgi:hypothetical protein
MRWSAPVLLAVASLTWSSSTNGHQRACNAAEAQKAEAEADTLRSWDALYKSYKRYQHCDDGAIAEGYSESVARILVDHWNTLPKLGSISKDDASFSRFVLSHVDATLDPTDVEKIMANATSRCPPGLHVTCVDLGKKAKFALGEINSVH